MDQEATDTTTTPGDKFTEHYECPNGHHSTIDGTVGQPIERWNYTNLEA